MTNHTLQAEIRQGCATASLGCVDCKKIFLNSLNCFMEPLHKRRTEIMARPGLVRDVLEAGNVKARVAAEATMVLVRQAMHLV